MRDIAVTLAVFGSLPLILKKPWIGIIVWTWLGFMNPHRMAWGFSTNMPFAYIVALTTFLSMMVNRVKLRIPKESEATVLALFVGWMVITTFNAVYPTLAWEQLEKVIKIQLMIFVGMVLITKPEQLLFLVWTISISIGVYGLKGGIFTIVHGGVYRVQGPPGTFIGGNNELGLAIAMTVPLLYFLARNATSGKWRPAMYSLAVLNVIAAIGTQSRGALLGIAAMGGMLWLKSRQKFLTALLGGITVFVIVQIMPAEWYARMNTISTYQQDSSAMGRLNAWQMASNLALHQFFGGGFGAFRGEMFALYAPNPDDVHDAHSIYFEVLGEHGFVGLFLFLLLIIFTWRSGATIRKAVKGVAGYAWLGELAAMAQVSLVGYLSAGAFLGMANFDYFYNIVLIMVVGKAILRQEGLLSMKQGWPTKPGLGKGLSPKVGT